MEKNKIDVMKTNSNHESEFWNNTLKVINSIIKKYNPNTDTFCITPYLTLDYDQSGSMLSCYDGKERLGNWKQKSPIEEFNNEAFTNLRYFQQTGQKEKTYSNCQTCWDSESHGVSSPRLKELVHAYMILGHDKFEQAIKKISNNSKGDILDVVKLEMRSSNYCNLQCLHCDHESSTQWLNFYSKPGIKEIALKTGRINEKFYKDPNEREKYKSYLTSDCVYQDEVNKSMETAKVIQWSGGEPMIDPNHIGWLEHLTNNKSNEQTMFYHTNLNVKNIEKFFPYWEKFNSIQVIVSLDCPPSTYSFFRRNSDYNLVKNNIDKIKSYFNSQIVQIACRITFNFFAALRWQEITDIWTANDWELHSHLVLQGPASSQYLPDELKLQCIDQIQKNLNDIDKYTTYSDKNKQKYIEYGYHCCNYLKSSTMYGNTLQSDLVYYLQMLDKHTDLKTLDFYPELEKYYNKTND